VGNCSLGTALDTGAALYAVIWVDCFTLVVVVELIYASRAYIYTISASYTGIYVNIY